MTVFEKEFTFLELLIIILVCALGAFLVALLFNISGAYP